MRTRKKHKLGNSPLTLVLCQVRFSPLLLMGEYVPRIQDRLRQQGYPINASAKVREFQLTATGAAARDRERWEFMSKDRRASVVITEGFVVLQTTAYDDFEKFVADLNEVVSTVNETVGGLLLERIGLRYVDAIVANAGETWRDYVQPSLHGFDSPLFKGPETLRLHQTIAATDVGQIIVRLHQNVDAAMLPPDLGTGALRAVPQVAKPGELVTLVDVDHYAPLDAREYEPKHLEDVAWKLKEGAYAVFADHIVTPHALEVWK
ncbi:MAG: TIGR04255 family protein [Myxococcota bacterium]|nr:TIGR04255 family protein [Myxococcota bacterium]